MAVMASDSSSPHSPSLRLGLPAPQPSRRHLKMNQIGHAVDVVNKTTMQFNSMMKDLQHEDAQIISN